MDINELLKKHPSIIDSFSISRTEGRSVLKIGVRSYEPLTVEEVLQFAKEHPEISEASLDDI